MITITYFGNLKDQLQRTEESIEWQSGTTEDLLKLLRKRGELWEAALAPENVFRVVVNEEMTFSEVDIAAGDRIALLPPVTGG
ncbi:MAG TPA: MoaD/ThiS family protein [Candidatus Ignatzschineria merdigallinarum]|uniref:MoaD/ThiS family protein n=1 Tax=Candidatus Ignatzschineria merdigallinarum TaxID=2838621 RepID=A0A9D1Q850_9GAMM|nr:MoaD/ThiS family protein [Candidatus Ignatzschineria merdigallinarum]